ncbi:hypothetical protein ACWODG_05540 [Enterococcus italicus]
MKYKVIEDFTDLQDNGHIYRTGDLFPRAGKVRKSRINELLSDKNKRGKPLIKEVEMKVVESQEG